MRKGLLIIISVFIGTIAMAQVLPNIGIRGGLTASSLNTTNASANFDSENVLGYQGGVFARINIGKFYIQPELIYNHRSTKLEYEIEPLIDLEEQAVGVHSEIAIGTFDIPVLLGFKIIKTKLLNLRVFIGPEISFATNKNITYDYTTSDGEEFEGQEGEISLDDFNKTTWYMQAGAGVDVLMFTFDIRYEKGLSDLFEGEVGDMGTINLKHNVWVFTLGLKFL